MLSTETPMNSPNRPPQLAMKSDFVVVSDRTKDIKYSSLNMIRTLLWASIKLKRTNFISFLSRDTIRWWKFVCHDKIFQNETFQELNWALETQNGIKKPFTFKLNIQTTYREPFFVCGRSLIISKGCNCTCDISRS